MSDKENTEIENEEVTTENTEQSSDQTEDTKEELSPLELKEIELKEMHDKYVRLFSEFDNFRKRTAKEKIVLLSTAGSDIIKQLLPVMDDFDRAIANNETAEDVEVVKEGFKLIHNKLTHNLTAKGLKATDAMGEDFDVNKHEALTQIPAPSKDMIGKVVDVVEKGYLLNDKVIRFAKVVVGQ